MADDALDLLEKQLQEVIQDLYEISVQVYAYQGPETAQALTHRIKSLTEHLIALSRSAPNLPVQIPPEIVEYVESGRNPDIYTREFIELVQRTNDHLRGKALAFRSFRDVLAREISGAMPELREEVERVVRETGGREPLGSWTGPAEGN